MHDLIIVMGVSGCGKTTLGKQLADALGYSFMEADHYHSATSLAKMARSEPLTDADREPWIQRMCDHLRTCARGGHVLAYSGLRRAHRQAFRELGYRTLFLHLEGPASVILERLQQRADHFMPPDLLDSQLAAMDPANEEEDMIPLDLTLSLTQQQEQAITTIRGKRSR